MATLATIDPIALAYHDQQIALELLSPPGLGKTSWAKAFGQTLADKYDEPVLVGIRHLSIEAPEEIAGVLGMRTVDNKLVAERTYPHLFPQMYDPVMFPSGWTEEQISDWRALSELPKRGIIVLDEFRQADEDQQKVGARFIDERTLDHYKMDDIGHYSIVLASNRAEDNSGVGKPMAFITNRKGEIEVDYSVDAHCEWMVVNGIHPKGIAYARAFPQDVHSPAVPDHDLPFVTPRSFVRACLFLQSLGVMDDKDVEGKNKIAVEGVMALIGEGATATFMGFLRRVENMIPMTEILKNPNGAKIPERPDVMWATIQMMVQFAKEHSGDTDVSPLLTYMLRFPEEFQTACIRMMVKANRKLFLDKRYSQWVRDNRELVMNAIAASNAAGQLS